MYVALKWKKVEIDCNVVQEPNMRNNAEKGGFSSDRGKEGREKNIIEEKEEDMLSTTCHI